MANLSNINNKFLVTTTGEVLVGRTAATGTSKLQVSGSLLIGTDINSGIPLVVQETTAAGFAIGFMRNTNATNGNGLVIDVNSTGGAYIQDWRQASTVKMRLLQNGFLGIGKPAPVYQLDVLGTGTYGGMIQMENTTANAYPRLAIQSDVKGYHIGVGGSGAGAGYANNLYFYDNNEAAVRMVIDTNGNVGIGTDTPNRKLTVQSGSYTYPSTGIDTNSYFAIANNSWAGMNFLSSNTTGGFIDFGDTDYGHRGRILYGHATDHMAFDTAGTTKMRIWSGGMIQIGNDSSATPELLTLQAYTQNQAFSGKYSASGYLWFLRNETGPSGRFQLYNAGSTTINLEGNTTRDSYILGDLGIGTTVTAGGFNVNSSTAGSYYNMSNVDSGNYNYTNPGGRLLTSNATGWFADGRDPILTLSSSGNSENSAIGNSIGLNLYTNSYTYGNFTPLITFSALSDSGSYASAYAAIAGRKVNRGPDTNWNTGDLCFWVTGPPASNPASYMQQTPAMTIKSGGNVVKPNSCAFSASTTAPGFSVTTVDAKVTYDTEIVDANGNYDPALSRFTAPVTGNYLIGTTNTCYISSVVTQFMAVYIVKNGNGTSYRFRGGGVDNNVNDWFGISGSVIIPLAQGDYVELFSYTNSGSFQIVNTEGHFYGYLIG